MLDYGGGFEVVPARPLVIRFDLTHARFSEVPAFSSFSETQTRTYLKVAVTWRFP